MARIATLVARTRAESPHTMLALAGDTISPSVMSAVLRGEQMIAAWNQLGLDVATFGNHEFDFGAPTLLARMRESRFAWVSANVLDRATGRLFGDARPTYVVERGGVQVGFFGLTVADTPHTSSPGPGVEFRDPIAAARVAVAEIRTGRRPIVVAVTHQDMPADEQMARAVPGIHLVIGGHEHDPLENVVGDTLITKAGSDGVFVVRIDLQVTPDGKVLARQHRFVPITPDLPEEILKLDQHVVDLNLWVVHARLGRAYLSIRDIGLFEDLRPCLVGLGMDDSRDDRAQLPIRFGGFGEPPTTIFAGRRALP